LILQAQPVPYSQLYNLTDMIRHYFKLLCLFIMAQISVLAHASHVTPEQAKQLAMRFFGQTRAASPTGAADIQLAYTASTSMRTQQAAYYVFNVANNHHRR
jgi:hypothetical protein